VDKSPAYEDFQEKRRDHWDAIAERLQHWQGFGGYYHKRLQEVYRLHVPDGCKVLEIGCGQGDLLAALNPSLGVGIDFSEKMIERARRRHPHLRFIWADAHELALNEQFDYIILSDLLNDVWDVHAVLKGLQEVSHARTRIITNHYSRLWELPLKAAEALGWAKPNLQQNWLTVEDQKNLLTISGFEVIRHIEEIIWPLPFPLVGPLMNKVLVRLWPFRHLALTNVIIAKPSPSITSEPRNPKVSVIVPARNEEGNIESIFQRLPALGSHTELILIEGHSSDDTFRIIKECMVKYPDVDAHLFRQTGVGKGDAVRRGFNEAHGDIVMILDADLTVPPEDLGVFVDVLTSGKGEFANGVRLVYPMEGEAMRFVNLVGNKFFSVAFSWMLGQPIKDTLCGTKVLWKKDYESIANNRAYFGDFDPFGDFDLLLGAAKLNLTIVDIPVRYRRRMYGTTNIQRWRHGALLLRMLLFASRRLKFV